MKAFLKDLFGNGDSSHSTGAVPTEPLEKDRETSPIPFKGFAEDLVNSGLVEFLSDEDLGRLNEMLPWKCFTVDSSGRRFGSSAWKGKRDIPQQIPDQRILEMDRLFRLRDRSVLEVGCFEGIHTIGIAQCGAKVYAIDSRIENVVKTLVRANMFGFAPSVCVCDLEVAEDVARLPRVDYAHHVGVLYHLKDPVTHLFTLGGIANDGMLLDTHYATTEMLNGCYTVNGKEYRYYKYGESGRGEVFSGMYDHAKWLLFDDIKEILAYVGFTDFRVVKDSPQRNGPRVTALVARPGVM